MAEVGPTLEDEAFWAQQRAQKEGQSREQLLAQLAAKANTRVGVEPFILAPRPCPLPSPGQAARIDVLRQLLAEGWDNVVKILKEDLPHYRSLVAQRFEAQRLADNARLVAATQGFTDSASNQVAGAYGGAAKQDAADGGYGSLAAPIVKLVGYALAGVYKAVGTPGGPIPEDRTLEDAANWSYRGFSPYLFFARWQLAQKQRAPGTEPRLVLADCLAAFQNEVNRVLAAYSAALDVDLFCAFPDNGPPTLETARAWWDESAILRADAARAWPAFWRMDKPPRPVYLLEGFPSPPAPTDGERFNAFISQLKGATPQPGSNPAPERPRDPSIGASGFPPLASVPVTPTLSDDRRAAPGWTAPGQNTGIVPPQLQGAGSGAALAVGVGLGAIVLGGAAVLLLRRKRRKKATP